MTAAGVNPAAAANVVINSGTTTVPGTQPSPWNVTGTLTVGNTATATLNIQSGGEVKSDGANVGNTNTAIGNVTVTGSGSSWTLNGKANVAVGGKANVSILNGGSINSIKATLASSPGSVADVTIDGDGSRWRTGNVEDPLNFAVGNVGTATLTLRNGAMLDTGDTSIAAGSGSGTATVTGTNTTWTSGSLVVGHGGDGTLTISDHAVVESSATSDEFAGRIGDMAGSRGVVTVSSEAQWTMHGKLRMSESTNTTGTLNIQSNALVANNGAELGRDGGSDARVFVDGEGATWDAAYADEIDADLIPMSLAIDGKAAVTVSNGGLVNSDDVTIAGGSTGNGTITVTGADSKWTMNALTLGQAGQGSLNILDSAILSSVGASIASSAGSSAAATIDGTASRWNAGTAAFTVGVSGNGSLSLSDGGTLRSGDGTIAAGAASTSTATVAGAGSKWTGGSLTVGQQGNGTLAIRDGGMVTSKADAGGVSGRIGSEAGSSGTVALSAGGSWTQDGLLAIGEAGSGALTIESGAKLSSVGARLGSAATVNIDGAGSRWDAGSSTFDLATTGTGSLGLRNGGVLLSGNSTIASGTGSSGTADVAGTGSSWTAGNLIVGRQGNGTLTISGGGQVSSTADGSGISGRIGSEAGSAGTVALSSGGSWTQNGLLAIGDAGSGTLTLESGATVTSKGARLGSGAVARIDGAGSRWDAGSDAFTVNTASTGSLGLRNGGQLLSGDSTIASGAGTSGAADVAGAGSKWTAGSLTVGQQGAGTLSISDGASVTSEADDDGVSGRIGSGAGSTGTVSLSSGGSWTQEGTLAIGEAGSGTLNIGAAAGSAAAGAGTLQATGVSLGNDGRIVFNHTDLSGNYVFATPISGSGAVLHENGVTVLTGTNTYTGATTVSGGTMVVDGSAASSAFTVQGAASLMGNGTVGSLDVDTGGKVAPGRSIGTLKVAGDVAFKPGTTLEVEINPAGNGDLIDATGKATLTGGTVLVRPAAGKYGARSYTILKADGGVTGTFDTLDVPDFAYLAASLDYKASAVDLVLNPTTTMDVIGVTPNQKAAAKGMASLGAGNPVYEAVLFSPTESAAMAALDALSGEIHASASAASYADARWVREAVLDRLRSQPCVDGAEGTEGLLSQRCAWAQGLGAWGSADGNSNVASLSTDTRGFVMGLEGTVKDRARLGLSGGYTNTSLDVDARHSSGDVSGVFGSLYGGVGFGALNLRGGVAGGTRNTDTTRKVSFNGFQDTLKASYGGYAVQGFGELGYAVKLRGATVEPIANLAVVHVSSDSFTEKGGAAALKGEGSSEQLATTLLAVRGEAALGDATAGSGPVVRGLLGWTHAFGDTAGEADLAFASGSEGFTVLGVPVAENAFVAQAALDWKVAGSFTAGLEYSGELAPEAQSHAVKANLSIAF